MNDKYYAKGSGLSISIVCALFFLVGAFSFALYFLCHSYDSLCHEYLSLGGCFYRASFWTKDCFTHLVYEKGRILCLCALIGTLVAFIYILKTSLRDKDRRVVYKVPLPDRFWLDFGLLVIIAIGLWCYGNAHMQPGSDEIFSAVNFAELNPFQTLSYYPIPNNHILYNLVNGILFFWYPDKVESGRFIALLGYIATIYVMYRWLRTVIVNRYLCLAACLLLMVQLTTWGFSFEGRGYSLYLLMAWIAFVSIVNYKPGTDRGRSLKYYSIASVVGFCLLPSFLYVYLVLLLFIVFRQVQERKWDRYMLPYVMLTGLFVFLFYLPCFCFSGYDAVVHNKYVAPSAGDIGTFWKEFRQEIFYNWEVCFSATNADSKILDIILIALPLFLLFSKKNRSYGIVYLLTWSTFIIMMFTMKRVPYPRAVNGIFSISMAMMVLVILMFIEMVTKKVRADVAVASTVFFLLSCGIWIGINGYRMMDYHLYGSFVNKKYEEAIRDIALLPAGATVAFSDEDFFWYYCCRYAGYRVSRCPRADEAYYLKR